MTPTVLDSLNPAGYNGSSADVVGSRSGIPYFGELYDIDSEDKIYMVQPNQSPNKIQFIKNAKSISNRANWCTMVQDRIEAGEDLLVNLDRLEYLMPTAGRSVLTVRICLDRKGEFKAMEVSTR